ncbi:MAG: hypothetical protein MUC95_03540 [Spirochaetes bacterium]|nr:hypothetical protein [Spirochaetota bacterium]
MRILTLVFIVFFNFYFFYTGCLTPKESAEKKKLSDNELAAEALSGPEKHFDNFKFNPDSEYYQRVSDPPPFIMKYIRELDKKEYTSYKITKEDLEKIENSYRQLPSLLQRMLKERVLEIYFINNFMGSGMTDWLVDSGRKLYFVMYFNPITLKMNMSEWLIYKEKTCFIDDMSDMDISIDAGKKYSAFLGILLHEAVHVADYTIHITPFVEENTRILSVVNGEKIKESQFVNGTWVDIELPAGKFDFKEREKISFYGLGGSPKLKISDAVNIYAVLSSTPFVSLYGSMSWAEDLSEFLLFYHLTQKLGQPYTITVLKNGKSVYQLEPMKGPDVQKRIRLMDIFYK